MTEKLWLGGYKRSAHQLVLSFGVDDFRFSTTYWYADLDLRVLEERYGAEFLEKIYFHIAAFEANKLCSLRPRTFDLGPFAHLHTAAFEKTWRTIVDKVWAQWRYEHDDPDYRGPEFVSRARAVEGSALTIEPGEIKALSFCGGGKDSLAALKLLEGAEIPFDSLGYSHSIYGRAQPQHELIDRLLDVAEPRHRRRIWIYDDFMDSPVTRLHPEIGVHHLLAGETPSSVFGALPLALQHGYTELIVGHERSADKGNLIWDRTGEEVNHQWGKSLEAELLLKHYVQQHLITNVDYFSLLKPIYDVLIFNLLDGHWDGVKVAHSCNESKPWCRRCAKCAYVWLNYMAYLPTELIDSIFGENLFDREENQLFYRQMLGLEEHTPFECIGTVEEARLAFELCRRKGLGGRAMEVFQQQVPAVDVAASLERFLRVEERNASMPSDYAGRLRPLFEEAASKVRSGRLVGAEGIVATSVTSVGTG